MTRWFSLPLAGVLSAALALPHVAQACEFHGYVPDPTVVDILLGTEQAVIAKIDPGNPGRYRPVEALLGPSEIDIPLPVGAGMRQKLAGPADAVLLAREEAYGPWVELAALDGSYRQVVDTVVSRQDAWLIGGDEERFQLFAGLVNHANPDLRRLALMELDRADYGLLKGLKLPKTQGLREALESGQEDLRPIRLLLAGLSGDKSKIALLSEGLDRAVAKEVAYMGAYATALIELQGAEAVQELLARHLSASGVSADTAEKLIQALAIQNQFARRPTRKAIASGVADLLAQNPSLAGPVARQFGFQADWSFAKPLQRAMAAKQPASIEDIFAINQYLSLAEEAGTDR